MKMIMVFPKGKTKAVTFSYDDGCHSDIRLIELMKKYGVRGTFNLNSSHFEGELNPNDVSLKEAKELYIEPDFEVAAHGYEHPFYPYMSPDSQTKDIMQDRINLEREFGKIVKGFAYPFGTYTKDTLNALRASGISYARTVKSTYDFYLPSDWLELNPTCHHRDERIFELIDRFFNNPEPPWNPVRMLYIWGHAYEFDFNEPRNNWEHAEKLLQTLSGHDEVWYATNGEIYDYKMAYDRLVVNLDKTIIYNPTDRELWFRMDDKTYSVGSGETLKL